MQSGGCVKKNNARGTGRVPLLLSAMGRRLGQRLIADYREPEGGSLDLPCGHVKEVLVWKRH